jgi:hypothetical protein
MKRLFLCLLLFFSSAMLFGADEMKGADAWFAELARRSTLILDGEIVETSLYSTVDEGTVNFSLRVRRNEVIRGEDPGRTVWVRLAGRPLDSKPQPAYLRKGRRCIFFLRINGDRWTGAGEWDSAQPFSPQLAAAVRRAVTLPR